MASSIGLRLYVIDLTYLFWALRAPLPRHATCSADATLWNAIREALHSPIPDRTSITYISMPAKHVQQLACQHQHPSRLAMQGQCDGRRLRACAVFHPSNFEPLN